MKKHRSSAALIPVERIERTIVRLRGHNVMFDADLAGLYGVTTRELIQAVKRNIERFPKDFMFQLSGEDFKILRSQFVTSRSGHGGRRNAPYVFREQGVAMLSSVLRSSRAAQVNDALEMKYDAQFKVVFQAIRELMAPPAASRKRIGFRLEKSVS